MLGLKGLVLGEDMSCSFFPGAVFSLDVPTDSFSNGMLRYVGALRALRVVG